MSHKAWIWAVVVREHYLRDDIPCGALPCAKSPATACDKESARLSPNNETILVIDTNVALHQIDLLENAAISNVVVEEIDLLENVAISNVVVLSVMLEEAIVFDSPISRHFTSPLAIPQYNPYRLPHHACLSDRPVGECSDQQRGGAVGGAGGGEESQLVVEEVKSRKVAAYGGLRALVAEESRRFFVFSNEHHNPSNPSTESQFMRELRRRREAQSSSSQSDAASKAPGAEAGGGGAGGSGAGGGAGMRDQRAVSNALNSEGLEGLPARAAELLKLGVSFYLPLWPFALAIITVFTAMYLFLGDFVHPGKSYGEGRQPPSYIDPYALLEEEEKYMERIPYDMSTYLKDNYDPELDG
ncbi:unnamed protein product [Closterium sp. Naga37s-1]|nr:unnamed protein product [Closterium sp. Naga37s-1]